MFYSFLDCLFVQFGSILDPTLEPFGPLWFKNKAALLRPRGIYLCSCPKRPKGSPNGLPKAPKMTHKAPKMVPKGRQMTPKVPQETPNGSQDAPKTHTENLTLVLPACSLARSSAHWLVPSPGLWASRGRFGLPNDHPNAPKTHTANHSFVWCFSGLVGFALAYPPPPLAGMAC
jgi:hypothetical protein